MREPHDTPRARQRELVVKAVGDEVLVYDLARHRAHALNRSAAAVWRHCDGRTTVGTMARRLATDRSGPSDEAVVEFALMQLSRVHLLEERRAGSVEYGLTRREVLRRVGVAAAATLPLVTTLTAPTAAAAASCISGGRSCTTSSECCPCKVGTAVCAPVTHKCACD